MGLKGAVFTNVRSSVVMWCIFLRFAMNTMVVSEMKLEHERQVAFEIAIFAAIVFNCGVFTHKTSPRFVSVNVVYHEEKRCCEIGAHLAVLDFGRFRGD